MAARRKAAARKPASKRKPTTRKNPAQGKKIKQLRGKVQDFRSEFGPLGSSDAGDTQDVTSDYIGSGFATTSNVRSQGKAYAIGQEGFGAGFYGESSVKSTSTYDPASDVSASGDYGDFGSAGGGSLGSPVGKSNARRPPISKSTAKKITQAKKAGSFQRAQAIRTRARKSR